MLSAFLRWLSIFSRHLHKYSKTSNNRDSGIFKRAVEVRAHLNGGREVVRLDLSRKILFNPPTKQLESNVHVA